MGAFMTDTRCVLVVHGARSRPCGAPSSASPGSSTAPTGTRSSRSSSAATRLVPIFRQRVVEPPGRLSTPRWTVDDRFDLTWHFRRIDAPAPHTPETVVSFAAQCRDDGLRSRAPVVGVHPRRGPRRRAGGAGDEGAPRAHRRHRRNAARAASLRRRSRSACTPAAGPDRADTASGSVPERSCATASHAIASRTLGFVRDTTGSLVPAAVRRRRVTPSRALDRGFRDRALDRPHRRPGDRDTLADHEGAKHRSAARHARGAARRSQARRRPAPMAASTTGSWPRSPAGFRRYHERHDAAVDELRVTLPISIRKPDDPPGGNRITLMRFAVPVSDADPASRIRAMGRLCHAARDERSLAFVDPIAATLNLLPRAAVAGMLKHVDFVASDIPGYAFPDLPRRRAGRAIVAFGPTIGAAVNLSLLSYDGTCCVGISIDTAAVPDPELLIELPPRGIRGSARAGRGARTRTPTPARRCVDA